MDEPRLGILLGPGGHGGKIVTDADERRTMAECICEWTDDGDGLVNLLDPACPVHGEKLRVDDDFQRVDEGPSAWPTPKGPHDPMPQRKPGAYHDGRKDKVPAPGEGDALPNPEMEVEC